MKKVIGAYIVITLIIFIWIGIEQFVPDDPKTYNKTSVNVIKDAIKSNVVDTGSEYRYYIKMEFWNDLNYEQKRMFLKMLAQYSIYKNGKPYVFLYDVETVTSIAEVYDNMTIEIY